MTQEREAIQPPRTSKRGRPRADPDELGPGEERVIELREEQLLANKQLRDVGEVVVRTEVDTIPGRLEVDALREEVEVEHEPVGEAVTERQDPWDQDGVLVIPVYEEQLVVTKRLVLRERLRVRRVRTTDRRLFQDTLRRDRLVVEDPQQTRLVHEVYPTEEHDEEQPPDGQSHQSHQSDQSDQSDAEEPERTDENGGFLTRLVTKALE